MKVKLFYKLYTGKTKLLSLMQQFMLEPAAVDTHNFIEYKASPNKSLFDKIQWEMKLFEKIHIKMNRKELKSFAWKRFCNYYVERWFLVNIKFIAKCPKTSCSSFIRIKGQTKIQFNGRYTFILLIDTLSLKVDHLKNI